MKPPTRNPFVATALLALLSPAVWAQEDSPQATQEKIADVQQALSELRRVNWQALPGEGRSELPAAIASTLAVRLPELPPKTTQPAAPTSQPTSQPAAPPAPADAAALRQLKELSAKGAADPLFLADALFSADRPADAEGFYEAALAAAPQGPARSWILFQTANCRRTRDPQGAKSLYQQLQKEHPDSPYAAVAAAQERLIDWRQEKGLAALLQKAAQAASQSPVP